MSDADVDSAPKGGTRLWVGALAEFERTREESGALRVRLRVPGADHAVFDGHFEGDPLLPGWVQVALVQELVGEAFGEIAGVSGVRFRGAVRPGDELVVTVDAARFDVATPTGSAASGRIARA